MSSEQAEASASCEAREATPEEIRDWDEIVRRFEQRRVYHEIAWIRSIEALDGTKPLFLVYEKNSKIVACMPGFLRRIGPFRIFGSPFEGCQTESMGPLFEAGQVSLSEFLPAFSRYVEERARVCHMEFVSNSLDQNTMQRLGFTGQPVFTYRVVLSPGNETATLARMKSNARGHLRKAVKLGLTVRQEHEDSFVAECYDQIKEVFARRGNAVIPFNEERVRICFRAMRESGNLIALSVRLPDTNVPIATGIFFADGRELILWCWTHRTQYRAYNPTELLTWTGMQEGMKRGCISLDMTGGGDAKLKFGAVEDQNVFRWFRSRYGWISAARALAKRAYRLQQRMRGRLARASSSSEPD